MQSNNELTYATITAGRWYHVPNKQQPLYLQRKLAEDHYVFSLGPGSDHGTRVTSIVGIYPMPAWFVPVDKAEYHEMQLIMMLVEEADRRGETDQFTQTVYNVKVSAVTKAYQAGMYRYPTIDMFAKECDRLTDDWSHDPTRALADIHEAYKESPTLAQYRTNLPAVPLVAIDTLTTDAQGAQEIGHNANDQEWDRAWRTVDQGIWTDSMSTCITVGFTALSADRTVRHNALIHSFKDFDGAAVITAVKQQFDGTNGVPTYASLKDVRYFVVGGAPDEYSIKKARQLIATLQKSGEQVLGVRLTIASSDAGKAKAVLLTKDGQVFCAAYQ